MALIIREPELAQLHAHACAGYPHEVVGILAGRRADNVVTTVVSLVNERADSPANRYHVSALVLYRAEQSLEAEGLEVVGYYHSHPDHPARYSDFDRDHALPNMSYVITSVVAGRIADTRSWRLRDDRTAMDEEPIRTED
ncbi:MAG: M67 family metallopeptidase [Pseudomonadota bacterium]|nr:M67 family metallopeptidase [Pseudomonadota bacterium]